MTVVWSRHDDVCVSGASIKSCRDKERVSEKEEGGGKEVESTVTSGITTLGGDKSD